MYPEEVCTPMRQELTSAGFKELTSAEEVDDALKNQNGTTLVLINSICGCAAGSARPGVIMSLENSKTPDNITTVFAGQDKDATDRARKYMLPYPPSSPSIALFNMVITPLNCFGVIRPPLIANIDFINKLIGSPCIVSSF